MTGCSTGGQSIGEPLNSSIESSYTESTPFYSVVIPGDFADRKNDGKTAFFGYGEKSKTGNTLIKIVDFNDSCSPSVTGASSGATLEKANGKAEWGRVDFWDHGMDYEPGTEPLCRAAGGPTGTGYALCSEKDGKTVVICISQMSDNPKLAEDIFKTFRWTKE